MKTEKDTSIFWNRFRFAWILSNLDICADLKIPADFRPNLPYRTKENSIADISPVTGVIGGVR